MNIQIAEIIEKYFADNFDGINFKVGWHNGTISIYSHTITMYAYDNFSNIKDLIADSIRELFDIGNDISVMGNTPSTFDVSIRENICDFSKVNKILIFQ